MFTVADPFGNNVQRIAIISRYLKMNETLPFGLEYETCILTFGENTGTKFSWLKNLQSYLTRLKRNINEDLRVWISLFDSEIYILDDDNQLFLFNLIHNDHPVFVSDESNIIDNAIKKYGKPLITFDSTVKCHNNLRKKQTHTNFNLLEGQYSINVEIVSHILYSRQELNFFIHLFIISDLFIRNKSQGVHLNISTAGFNNSNLRKLIKEQYSSWENLHYSKFRPSGSNWAMALSKNKIKNLDNTDKNLTNILTKTNSVRYKVNNIIEIRLLTPVDNLRDHIFELLDMFGKMKGGHRKKTKHKNKKQRLTKKLKKNVYVFVYGSLRKGLQNHYRITEMGANYMGEFETTNMYYMIGLKSGAYPYVTKEKVSDDANISHIRGEIYEIKRTCLQDLDILEGSPINYIRRLDDFYEIDTNKKKKAFIYMLENKELIDGIRASFGKRFVNINDGNWLSYVHRH